MNAKCKLLLEENSRLKLKLEALDKVLSRTGGLQCAHLDGNKDEGLDNPIFCNAGGSTQVVKNHSISSSLAHASDLGIVGSSDLGIAVLSPAR